jgi:hypothetical protein
MTARQTANIPSANRDPVVDKEGYLTRSWTTFINDLWRRVGGGAAYSLGGTLTNVTTAVGNVGAGEDTLMSYTLPKNTLGNAGDKLEIEAFGTLAANGNSKTIKLYFGSQVIFSTGAVASNALDWHIRAAVLRTGAATQIITSQFSGDTVLVTQTADFVAGTQSLAADVIIKCTGEATSNDDISQKGLIVNYWPTNG